MQKLSILAINYFFAGTAVNAMSQTKTVFLSTANIFADFLGIEKEKISVAVSGLSNARINVRSEVKAQ